MAVNETDFAQYVKDSGLYAKLTEEQKSNINAALNIAKDFLMDRNATDQITKDTALIIFHQMFVTGVMKEEDMRPESRLATLVKNALVRAGELDDNLTIVKVTDETAGINWNGIEWKDRSQSKGIVEAAQRASQQRQAEASAEADADKKYGKGRATTEQMAQAWGVAPKRKPFEQTLNEMGIPFRTEGNKTKVEIKSGGFRITQEYHGESRSPAWARLKQAEGFILMVKGDDKMAWDWANGFHKNDGKTSIDGYNGEKTPNRQYTELIVDDLKWNERRVDPDEFGQVLREIRYWSSPEYAHRLIDTGEVPADKAGIGFGAANWDVGLDWITRLSNDYAVVGRTKLGRLAGRVFGVRKQAENEERAAHFEENFKGLIADNIAKVDATGQKILNDQFYKKAAADLDFLKRRHSDKLDKKGVAVDPMGAAVRRVIAELDMQMAALPKSGKLAMAR